MSDQGQSVIKKSVLEIKKKVPSVSDMGVQSEQQTLQRNCESGISSHSEDSDSEVELAELEKEKLAALQEIKKTEKQIYLLDDDAECKQKKCKALELQNQAIYIENIRLKMNIEEEEENVAKLLSENNVYRKKMATHRELIAVVENKLPFMIELAEKKETVKKLREKKQELAADLQNPEGNLIKQVQAEIAVIKVQIATTKEAIADQVTLLSKEHDVHNKLQKEIEMQNKRCEAILKRLHSQLNKAQSKKRQWNWDIQQMEKTVAYMKKCLGMKD
ncbi:coiled-coil domain-containing protein 122 [Protopterus annectens]|uniref:coiled-coil domain-containing protein 122 n=1 Tax=Protopterus annectens TaxID=7888 RepID=UPI001CF936D1|nr:coiled-coil domain-containing protein 122 [Protopterus annectens]